MNAYQIAQSELICEQLAAKKVQDAMKVLIDLRSYYYSNGRKSEGKQESVQDVNQKIAELQRSESQLKSELKTYKEMITELRTENAKLKAAGGSVPTVASPDKARPTRDHFSENCVNLSSTSSKSEKTLIDPKPTQQDESQPAKAKEAQTALTPSIKIETTGMPRCLRRFGDELVVGTYTGDVMFIGKNGKIN